MGTIMEMKRDPRLHLCECDLPEIKDWKVGEKYTITLEMEMTGLREDEMAMMDKNETMLAADFKILSITPKGGKTVDTEDDTEEADTEEVDTEETDEEDTKETPKVAQAVKRKMETE